MFILLYDLIWMFLSQPPQLRLLENAWPLNLLLLAAGNVVFLLTDATLARLTRVWHWKLKKHLYR